MQPPTPTSRPLVWAWVLALATLFAYAPSLPGEFIWDDDDYVTANTLLHDGPGLAKIWEVGNTPQYYPITFSSFWLEYQLWGLNPLGYHLVNLLLHIGTGLLLWRLLRRLEVPVAFFVAAAFLLHPQHVETVAWVMERKNTLSALFYLLAANAYLTFELRRVRDPASAGGSAARAYLLALACFALGLMSKTIICTLPAALILMRFYRRRSVDRAALVPLVPFFALGLALAAVTTSIEHGDLGASGAEYAFSLPERVLIASRAVLAYSSHLLFPHPLLFQYPRWTIDASSAVAWLAPVAVLGVFAYLALLWRRGRCAPFLAASFFVGSLSPALGFISFYPMKFSFVADHFNYLPSVGFLALVAGGVHWLIRAHAGPSAPQILRTGSAVALAALAALTAVQSHHFRSAESIYRHTLAHHPGAFLASGTLAKLTLDRAQTQFAEGDVEAAQETLLEAERLYGDSLQALPDDYDLLFSYALTQRLLGKPELALTYAVRATERKPKRHDAWHLTGALKQQLGDLVGAEQAFQEALTRPARDLRSLIAAGRGLAECQAKLGRKREALATIESILRSVPPEIRVQAGPALKRHIEGIEPGE